MLRSAALAAALLAGTGAGRAQDVDPAAAGRFRRGPIAMTPSIALTGLGFDSNVFYETINPKSDLVAAIQPRLDAWMRLGRSTLAWSGVADGILFKRYSNQQTFGTNQALRLDVPVNRVRFSVNGSWVSARERPGFEIDTRARRTEKTGGASIDVRLSALTQVTASVRRGHVAFASDAVFDDRSLAIALDRSTDDVSVSVQHAFTPLSSLVVAYSASADRFDHDPARNSRFRRISGGFAFKPLALVSGRIDAGVMTFRPADPALKSLAAPSIGGDLGYTLRGVTHFSTRIDRGVNYSIDVAAAYYVLTGISGGVTHSLSDTVSLTATVMRQHLAYQGDAAGPAAPRPVLIPSSDVTGYDVAVGRQLPNGVRIGWHAAYMTRASTGDAVVPGYKDFRTFISVGYGTNR